MHNLLTTALEVAYDYFFNRMDFLKSNVRRMANAFSLTEDSMKVLSYLYKHRIECFEGHNQLDILSSMSLYDFQKAWEEISKKGLGYRDNLYHVFLNVIENSNWDNTVIHQPVEKSVFSKDREVYTPEKYIDLIVSCSESIWERVEDSSLYGNVTLFDCVAKENVYFEQFADYLDMASRQNLTDDEKVVLIAAAGKFVQGGTQPFQISSQTRDVSDEFEKGTSGLLKKGLLDMVVMSSDDKDDKKDFFILSIKACRVLFRGYSTLIRYDDICRQANIIKCEDIKDKELFYDSETLESINDLYEIVSADKFESIIGRLRERGRKCGIACLLHGAPGTGKTELVKQLARKSGRDVVIADVSKLYGMFWGESEKNFKDLFRNIKYLNILSSQAPIVLFDEADGILGKRLTVTRAIEKSENAIQSILLQELETFEGIFMATTNVACNLDPAFDRRFIFKIEFKRPDPEVSQRIWKSQMPELGDDDALSLAESFAMSGGQIDNIVRKCEIRYVLKGDWPLMEEIKHFCDEEVGMTRTESRPRIKGFSQYK